MACCYKSKDGDPCQFNAGMGINRGKHTTDFYTVMEKDYKYKGENYCLFHVPKFYKNGNSREKNGSFNDFNETLNTIIGGTQNSEIINLEGVHFPAHFQFKSFNARKVNFNRAKFSKDFILRDRILDNCSFNSTVFKRKAIFEDVSLNNVSFRKTIFQGDALFSCEEEMKANKSIKFVGSEFWRKAHFSNRKFGNGCTFLRSVFHNNAPIFHGCKFHSSIKFPKEENFKAEGYSGASEAYTELRLRMSEMKRHREEGMFFALEQRSLRNTNELSFWENLTSEFFDNVSNYGRNFLRPLGFLLLLIILCSLFYMYIFEENCSFENCYWGVEKFEVSLHYSIEQALLPFYSLRDEPSIIFGSMSFGQKFLFYLVSLFQSTFSLALIFLSGQALRWRFRRA